jgi:hypothetical protein
MVCNSCAFEAQRQATVALAGVKDAVSISDRAVPVGADIEKRIPIRAIAGKARDLDELGETDLTQRHASYRVCEALAMRPSRAAEAEIGIDDVDICLVPPEFVGAGLNGVLRLSVFRVADDLMWRSLMDVDHRTALKMARGHEFRARGSPPSERPLEFR